MHASSSIELGGGLFAFRREAAAPTIWYLNFGDLSFGIFRGLRSEAPCFIHLAWDVTPTFCAAAILAA
jgi:hypothetical protein